MRREHVHNELTQAERRKVMRDTLHGRAVADEGMVAGRYGAISKTRVTGAAPIEYPALPKSSWVNQGAVVPPEEPLGYSVEDHPAVGEIHEIALSEARCGAGQSPPEVVDGALPDEEQRFSSGAAPSSPLHSKRKSRRR